MMFSFLHSDTRSKRRHRSGFTLPELLVVIAIIGILSSAMMAGMASVTQKAKIDRTRSQIAKIHSIIMEKWQSYETRRVNNRSGAFRIWALRELMRLELPQRGYDIQTLIRLQNWGALPGNALNSAPSLARSYARRIANVPAHWTQTFDDAECLYLIVSKMSVGDANALELFNESEIGDIDGDGMREFHDAWGNPIRFIRWPAGFAGPAFQTYKKVADGDEDLVPPDVRFDRIKRIEDPFDPTRQDLRWQDDNINNDPYYLIPLIFSAGPDGTSIPTGGWDIWGLVESGAGKPAAININDPYFADSTYDTGKAMKYDNTDDVVGDGSVNEDPQHMGYLSGRVMAGASYDTQGDGIDNSLDNIHNHLISTR